MSLTIGPDHGAVQRSATAESDAEDARLREACVQLEGIFLEQLMKALRDTVPEGGVIDGGAAEEVFSSMLDGHIAMQASSGVERGLATALYRQLRGPEGDAV